MCADADADACSSDGQKTCCSGGTVRRLSELAAEDARRMVTSVTSSLRALVAENTVIYRRQLSYRIAALSRPMPMPCVALRCCAALRGTATHRSRCDRAFRGCLHVKQNSETNQLVDMVYLPSKLRAAVGVALLYDRPIADVIVVDDWLK